MSEVKAISSSTPQGYPIDILEGGEADQRFLCTICKLLLKNTVQGSCGHRFCQECIECQFRICGEETLTCPGCIYEQTVIEESELQREQIFPDFASRREILNLPVHCRFAGCDWSGILKNFASHCEECGFYPMECPTCKETISRNEFDQHLSSHNRLSDAKPGDLCPFQCGQTIGEQGFLYHVTNEMPKHLEVIFLKLTTLENQVHSNASAAGVSLTTKLEEIEKRLRDVSLKADSGQHAERSGAAGSVPGNNSDAVELLQEMFSQLVVFENVIIVLKNEAERLTVRSDQSGQQRLADRELIDAMDRKVRAQERTLAMKDVTLAELEQRTTALELSSVNGTLLWKISDVSRRRQEAVTGRTPSVYSPIFYTSNTGYKMCARVYFNGDGSGKGTHLAVFFLVMRGSYDAILPWPFKQKVTLILLNQVEGQTNIVDSFRPDPSSSSFKRPVTEMNIASGCPLFAPLTTLERRDFVVDDTLFIKVIVDCQGI